MPQPKLCTQPRQTSFPYPRHHCAPHHGSRMTSKPIAPTNLLNGREPLTEPERDLDAIPAGVWATG